MQILTRGRLTAALTGVILAGAVAPAAQAAERPLYCDWLAADSVVYCGPSVASTARCRGWTVTRIGTPAERARLVVSAVCLAGPGERVALRRHEPQGINPRDLLLELVVYVGPFPDIPAARPARVVHVELDAGFRTVTVLPDGPTLPVEPAG